MGGAVVGSHPDAPGVERPAPGHRRCRGVVLRIRGEPLRGALAPSPSVGGGAGRFVTGGGKRLGVMGGTFDPIHHGHLVTAEEALWQFHLDEVVFVPTGQPWMKADRAVSSSEDRYLMTVIATSSNPKFTVSRVEVDRDGPTYTVDTLREIRTQSGPCELFFITGADAMLEIFHWKDSEAVLSQAHFIAATRPGYDIARFQKEAPPSHTT